MHLFLYSIFTAAFYGSQYKNSALRHGSVAVGRNYVFATLSGCFTLNGNTAYPSYEMNDLTVTVLYGADITVRAKV